MEKLTYKQAFDKITEAYIKDEIKPLVPRFCFCGTLCNNSNKWHNSTYKSRYNNQPHHNYLHYSGSEYSRMESALFNHVGGMAGHTRYEDFLFEGMCAALEVLKQIHIERGEVIDEVPAFTKRQLQTTL